MSKYNADSGMFAYLKSLRRDREGAVAILFGLMILPIMGSAGLATDISRTWLSRSKLDYAVDAAALAVGSSVGTREAMEARAEAFVRANFESSAMAGTLTEVDVELVGSTVTVTVAATVPTSMMRVVGKEEVRIASTATSVREVLGVEVALVLDNTGSMRSNNNIGALRDASHIFMDMVTRDDTSAERLKVALVPYSAQVNPGDEAPELVEGSSEAADYADRDDGSQCNDVGRDRRGRGRDRDNCNNNNNSNGNSQSDQSSVWDAFIYDPSAPERWKGCVQERDYPHDIFDTSLDEGGYWQRSRWLAGPDNPWQGNNHSIQNDPDRCNRQTGPNLGCPTPITPLTNDFGRVRSDIDALESWCRGGTIGSIGMAWGWRVLSPEPPFTQGEEWNSDRWVKVAVMMTDGDNLIYRDSSNTVYGSDYMAYGRIDDGRLGTTSINQARGVINDNLLEVCSQMKARGILIYTITFSSGISSSTRDIYRSCATDPDKYFNAPSQQDLRDVFATIGGELSNLRLSR